MSNPRKPSTSRVTSATRQPAADQKPAQDQPQQQLDPVYVRSLCNSLEQQRNQALNANAELTAQVATLQNQLQQAVNIMQKHGLVKVTQHEGGVIAEFLDNPALPIDPPSAG